MSCNEVFGPVATVGVYGGDPAEHVRVGQMRVDDVGPRPADERDELRDRELSVGDLCEALGFTQSNASQHLAVLRERGIVAARRSGSNVFYSLRSQPSWAAWRRW